MGLELMYITNDVNIAAIVDRCGVDRVFVDLEKLGKDERQKGNTVKSNHSISDVAKVKPFVKNSKLLVRINPMNPSSREEIEQVINNGADIIMLPYYKTPQEVIAFLDMVAGRTKNILLLETKEAHECLEEVLKIEGVDEFHIGLNDLHLSYHKRFMFELFIDGTVKDIVHKIAAKGLPFGIGGIAKIGEGLLPAEHVITEHYRLGSTAAILSRSFCEANYYFSNPGEFEVEFMEGVNEIRAFEEKLPYKDSHYFQQNYMEIERIIQTIVNK